MDPKRRLESSTNGQGWGFALMTKVQLETILEQQLVATTYKEIPDQCIRPADFSGFLCSHIKRWATACDEMEMYKYLSRRINSEDQKKVSSVIQVTVKKPIASLRLMHSSAGHPWRAFFKAISRKLRAKLRYLWEGLHYLKGKLNKY